MAIQLIRRYHDGGVSIKDYARQKNGIENAMFAREAAMITELGKEKVGPKGEVEWNAPILVDVQVRLTGFHAKRKG